MSGSAVLEERWRNLKDGERSRLVNDVIPTSTSVEEALDKRLPDLIVNFDRELGQSEFLPGIT